MKPQLDTCVLSELVKFEPDAQALRWFQAIKAYEHCIEVAFEKRVLAFDGKAAKIWAEMTSEAESQGKSMSAIDSIIAATARASGCKLVTRKVKDFNHAGIEVLDPWLKNELFKPP